MARPKRGNYATGDAGQARYRKAVREYNEKLKKAREEKAKKNKLSTEKNIKKQKTDNKKAALLLGLKQQLSLKQPLNLKLQQQKDKP